MCGGMAQGSIHAPWICGLPICASNWRTIRRSRYSFSRCRASATSSGQSPRADEWGPVKLPFKARTISTVVVIPSVIIVAALAILQYRWSTRVSEATAIRLADSLQMSMMNWQKDFFRYFSEIGLALRIDPVEDTPGDVGQYVRRFAEWKAVAKYPALVANVYLLKSDRTALRLNSSLRRFEPEQWPLRFEPLRPELRSVSEAFLRSRTLQAPHGVF